MTARITMLRTLTLAALTAFAAACSSDGDPTEPVPQALAGAWEATPDCRPSCVFSVVLSDDPANPISILDPPISASVLVSIHTGGGFVLSAELHDTEFSAAGSARTSGSSIYITLPSGAVDTATYSIAGDLLTLEYQNEIRGIDFTGDGSADPGRVQAVLRRR